MSTAKIKTLINECLNSIENYKANSKKYKTLVQETDTYLK